MKAIRILILYLFFLPVAREAAIAQPKQGFLRSTPEAEGVSSSGILEFLEAVGNSKHELHSFMLLRHGKLTADGWWDPYKPELKHTMYSVSKSFTSTAAGLAVNEKKLRLTDKVISFFPNDLPDSISPYLAELTVRDLLTMSVGHEPEPTTALVAQSDWIKSFLARPIVHKPGTTFLYNTMATYMVSAIVQKVTGQKLIDYLRPRLFQPLGITDFDWESDPKGINVGGWGLRIQTEAMARFGQLYLQKGKWAGKQVIPASWVEEATTFKILQSPEATQSRRDSSDWLQGYCYQFWRSRNNSYRADGAYGQFIIVMPDQDAVVIMTAETPDMQGQIDLAWKHLLPAMNEGILPENKQSSEALKVKLSSLSLAPPAKSASPLAREISGKTYAFNKNEMNIETISFAFRGDVCAVTIKTTNDQYAISFGSGFWTPGQTRRHGPYLLPDAKGKFVGLPPFKIAGSYQWTGEKTLKLVLRYIESPHTEYISCRFEGETLTMESDNSIGFGKELPAIVGTRKE